MVSGGAETLPVVGEDAFVDHDDEEGTHAVKASGEQLHKHCQRFVRHPRQVLIAARASPLLLPSLPNLPTVVRARARKRCTRTSNNFRLLQSLHHWQINIYISVNRRAKCPFDSLGDCVNNNLLIKNIINKTQTQSFPSHSFNGNKYTSWFSFHV